MTQANDMRGKTVLITGATGGIGKETAIGLAQRGATVVITGRDRARGEAGLAEIKQRSGNTDVALLLADLSRQADIRRLAETFNAQHDRLDVLINNVGGLYSARWLTADGIEATLAMNHLGPFLLTHLLLDQLKRSAPARVINVTGGMPPSKLDLDNLQAEKRFQGLETYSHAKGVMMAVAYEFAQRLTGSGVTLNVAYPGAASTAMTQAMTPDMVPWFMRVLWPIFTRFMGDAPPARAARSSIYLASSPDVANVNGAYYNTNSKPARWPKPAHDAALRQRLWQISAQLTGLRADLIQTTPATIGASSVAV